MKTDSILKQVLMEIKPSDKEMNEIHSITNNYLSKIKNKIRQLNIKAEPFVGGSIPKGTVIKKDYYDNDIFIRFYDKHKEKDLSKLTGKIIQDFKPQKIHGSRDYFRIKVKDDLFLEIVPVRKVSSPKEAVNITDLSYSHVIYINKRIKNKKTLDEIRLAKAFCYANGIYGAESYVNGFSGYALELIVYKYKTFMGFIRAMAKVKNKLVIDIEKLHKNSKSIMLDLNASKLKSPIILIDPTYKQRNALAALSYETFSKFQKVCKAFISKPSINAFKIKKVDIDKIKKTAKKNRNDFIQIIIKTNKQAGDIAGSKLLKFYKHLESEISKYFKVKSKGFEYNKEDNATLYFVAKNKGYTIFSGPKTNDKKNALKFKNKHKSTTVKKGKLYAKKKIKFDLKSFISNWKAINKRKLVEMYITGFKVN